MLQADVQINLMQLW